MPGKVKPECHYLSLQFQVRLSSSCRIEVTLSKDHPAPPPLPPCPLFPYLQGLVLPWGPYSVLSSSAVSSMRCQRLRTCYRGLPLVHLLPCGVSGFTQPDAHVGPCSPLTSACPEHRNSGPKQALSLPPLPLHPQPHKQQFWDSSHSSCLGST